MAHIVHVLIGDSHSVADAAVKTLALFLTATAVFRLASRRTLATAFYSRLGTAHDLTSCLDTRCCLVPARAPTAGSR